MRKNNICSLVLIKILMGLWRLGNTGYRKKKKEDDERKNDTGYSHRLACIHFIRPQIHF